MKLKGTAAAFLAAAASVALIVVLLVSCGQSESASGPGTIGSTGMLAGGNSCLTPNQGCPCTTPGQIVDCGKVSHVGPGGYVACQMGHRTCVGTEWGACVGDYDVVTTKNLVAAGGLHPLSLGQSQVCPTDGGAYSNICDPYCNYFLDTPEGGIDGGGTVVINDAGGITIDPTADGGVTGGGGFSAPQSGVSGCSPNRNIVGPACTAANALTTCQQDFRCDPTTLQCLWNGNTAYYNPAVAGVDLTIESPCGPQGSANSSAVVCNRGSATLAAGASITFFVSTGSSPPNSCTNLGAPTQTNTLASALAAGQCTSFTLSNSTGAKFITVNAGLPGGPGAPAVTEAAGYCANNSAYWRTDGSGGTCALCNSCVTTLTGTIYDPGGSNVLPDVTVYVPAGTPSALPLAAACDTCTSLITGTPWSLATTDYKGNFSITVPDSATFPLVIQAGRWRRRLTIPAITACTTQSLDAFCKSSGGCKQYNPTTSTYTACSGTGIAAPLDINQTSGGNPTCSRLPGSQAEGDLPTMALVQAAGDQLECLMRKVGVADSEFTKAGGGGKISLFSHNGMTWAGETADSALWGSSTTGAGSTFSSYAAIIAPCDNNHTTYVNSVTGPSTSITNAPNPSATAPQQTNMGTYLNTGGRLFTTHWFAFDWLATNYPTAVTNVYGTAVDNDREAPQFDFSVDQTTTTGQLYANWLNYVGASPGGAGTVRFLSWRHLPQSVNIPNTVRLAYGDSSKAPVSHSPPGAGPLVAAYQFNTPYGSANPCGRVEVAMSHVSAYGSGAFPAGCGWATGTAAPQMTAQEQAFEFLIFNSQQCLGLVPTVPPPSTPALPTVTFTRDYQGVCPTGKMVKWGVFYWEAAIPGMSNIQFSAATADTQAALPAAQGTQPTATSRVIGNATVTSTAPAWDCGGCPSSPVTVDYHLNNDTPAPNTPSKAWLRVFMTFTPDNSVNPPVSPTLNAWRQTYDCVPSE